MLRIQLIVADFEREVARVRAVEVQLLERRMARRARQAERHGHGVSRAQEQAEGARDVVEVPRQKAALGLVRRVVVAAAELHDHMTPAQLLVDEGGRASLIDRRRQRLRAVGLERSRQSPAADRALQAAERAMVGQQLELRCVVAELSADLLAFELVVA